MSPSSEEERLVVSERDVLEVLAFLIAAARTQLDEAAEYAPLRLLTAAGKLGEATGGRASEPVRALIAEIDAIPATATPSSDPRAYVALVDDLCVALADCLLAMDGRA